MFGSNWTQRGVLIGNFGFNFMYVYSTHINDKLHRNNLVAFITLLITYFLGVTHVFCFLLPYVIEVDSAVDQLWSAFSPLVAIFHLTYWSTVSSSAYWASSSGRSINLVLITILLAYFVNMVHVFLGI